MRQRTKSMIIFSQATFTLPLPPPPLPPKSTTHHTRAHTQKREETHSKHISGSHSGEIESIRYARCIMGNVRL